MEHLALLFVVLSIMMGIAAIIRSFSVYNLHKERYLRFLALFTVFVWIGNSIRLVISYLDFNTAFVSSGMLAVSTIVESAFTLMGVLFLVVSIRLLVKNRMRLFWWLFLLIASAVIVVISNNALSNVSGIHPAPKQLLFVLQLVLFGVYLSIAAIVFLDGASRPRLGKLAIRGLALFVAVRPSLDFSLNVLHAYATLTYYYFLILQYLVEFLTYLFIFIFIQRFALFISVPDAITTGQAAINKDLFSLYSISERERQVIEQVLAGFSNRKISERLFISVRTVKDHIYNIYKKTEVKNRVQLSNLFRKS